jgi:RHS repeat-associated protein
LTSGQSASTVTLSAAVLENDQPIDFEAAALSAVEGEDIVLLYAYESPALVEYYVEDVSAEEGTHYTDPNNTSSTSWATLNSTGQFEFPTIPTTAYEGTRSFKIHLRIAGYPSSEIILEADLFDPQDLITQTVDYSYDPFNQLLRRTHDPDGPLESAATITDTYFSYQHNQIVLQFNGDEAADLSHRYLWNPAAIDQLLADEQVTSLTSAGTVLWPLADHLGTIRDLATHNSTTHATDIVNHRKYDSYGNLISESNTATDEIFGYTGRLFDDAAQLQYNTNRWYDSRTGRWISEDPIGFTAGDSNLNRYVGNSPVDRIDPSGRDYIDLGDVPSGPSRPLKGGTIGHDYWYFLPPWVRPEKKDWTDLCITGGKWAGWTTAVVAGTAAGGLLILELATGEVILVEGYIVKGTLEGGGGIIQLRPMGGKPWCRLDVHTLGGKPPPKVHIDIDPWKIKHWPWRE